MTIRRRFTIVLMGLTLLVLSVFSATFYFLEYRSATLRRQESQDAALEKTAAVCRESLLGSNPLPAINYINILKREPGVVSAACLDMEGRMLAHSDPSQVGLLSRDPGDRRALSVQAPARTLAGPGAADAPRMLELAAPVATQSSKHGAVRIAYDQGLIEDRIRQDLLNVLLRILLVSSITFLAVLGIALVLAANLTRPIDRLVEAARAVGSGNLDHKVAMTGRKDEFGFLAREFDSMSGRLKEIDELKDKFLQNVTHDLRSPLTAIRGYTELMLMGFGEDSKEAQAKYLEVIDRSAKNLASLIDDILDLSKLEAGRLELESGPIELQKVLSEVVELLSVTAKQMEVTLICRVPRGVPSIPGDPKQIARALTNLISNSLKFTPAGGNVTLSIAPDSPGFLRVSVKDTGVGIPGDKLDKVFGKFFQVHETRGNARKAGTGLGLTITKEIVEAHGGRIWVESRLNAGADFIFTLPVASAPIDKGAPAAHNPNAAPRGRAPA